MRKLSYISAMICLIEEIFSMQFCLDIKKRCDDKILITYQGNKKEIREKETIYMENIGQGSWDGNFFVLTLSSENPFIEKLKICSKNIPFAFSNFYGKNCEIETPEISIFGKSGIENFSVILNSRSKPAVFNAAGLLMTENCKISVKNELSFSKLQLQMAGNIFSRKNLTIAPITDSLKIINRGVINMIVSDEGVISSSGEISCSSCEFINKKSGQIYARKADFGITKFKNFGLLEFSDMTLLCANGMANVPFLQKGVCIIHNNMNTDCEVRNYGETYIEKKLNFCPNSNLKILQEPKKTNGSIDIQNQERAIKCIGKDSKLIIQHLNSSRKTYISTESDGTITIQGGEVSEGFIHSDSGELNIFGLKNLNAYVKGEAKLNINAVENFEIFSTGNAHGNIKNSRVNSAYYLGDSQNKISNSEVDSVMNKAKVSVKNADINKIINERNCSLSIGTFFNKNYVNTVQNSGTITCDKGNHILGLYKGESKKSQLIVKGNTNSISEGRNKVDFKMLTDKGAQSYLKRIGESAHIKVNSKGMPQVYVNELPINAILLNGDAKVYLGQIDGQTHIKSDLQMYLNKLPKNTVLDGEVNACMSKMPKPEEIPFVNGELKIFVNMNEDFVNTSDVNYRNAIFLMNMNGFNWKNISALFQAGGLGINRANIFENDNGQIKLDEHFGVICNRFLNSAAPIARDNGRLVIDNSSWRTSLVYYCPATYYNRNTQKGITVGKDVFISSKEDITNSFSTIFSREGTFYAESGNKFINRVGQIISCGNGPSKIIAECISNECLEACVRRGEAHAQGRCGWGFGRKTWYADSRTVEWVTQSPGANIRVGGDLDLIGYTRNFGSTILSGRYLNGDILMQSLLENTAIAGGVLNTFNGNSAYIRGRIFSFSADLARK